MTTPGSAPARRIRVLQLIQNLNYGGMERLLADIVRRVDRERFESHVLCLQYLGRFSEGLEDWAELHVAEPMTRASMIWPASLIRQIRRIGPDVVHTHSGVWYKGTLAARRAGVPLLIHTEHGRHVPDPAMSRIVDGFAARRTDHVVAVSEQLARLLRSSLRVDPSRVQVVYNGVDTDEFRPRTDDQVLRAELGIGAATPIIGSIGRLEYVKGYDVMIEAFARLRASWHEDPAPVLVIAGEGRQRPALVELVKQHSLEAAVRLLGWRDDVHDLHAAFALFTMSSRSEGTSVSLLEAMAAGLCPVVTDVGANGHILGHELSHRLLPAEDPAALAAAWRSALSQPDRLRADGAAARRRVSDAFGLERMVSAYERLYAQPT